MPAWTSITPSPSPPDRRNGVLTTLRSDGRPQQSVIFFVADGDRFTMSITDGRAKTRNLRRDPRAALFIAGDDVFTWVSLDGHVELSPVARDPDDADGRPPGRVLPGGQRRARRLGRVPRAWSTDGRLVATFVATSATGILPD